MSRTKQTKPVFSFSPFEKLKGFLDRDNTASEKTRHAVMESGDAGSAGEEGRECDARIFLEAVSDVKPILSAGHEKRPFPDHQPVEFISEDKECLRKMRELVSHGRGFVIADTQEYIEGTGYNVHSGVAGRLHRGDFAVQGHIDLHGFLPFDAGEAFDGFMKQALRKGWRTVLIIHGRGLSSPEEPVIKNRVIELLQSHRWKKWVIAYASARSCDGGTGATYVLLRQRPSARQPAKRRSPDE